VRRCNEDSSRIWLELLFCFSQVGKQRKPQVFAYDLSMLAIGLNILISVAGLPSLPGVTPPTMLVPYSKLSLAFPVATRPVNPC
jgi:hypothetical protein